MHVSGKWLSEMVDLPKDTTPTQIADRLTAAGLEVEGIEEFARGLSGVVVARVIACVPHENADKLRVCTVDGGTATADGPVIVVCGALCWLQKCRKFPLSVRNYTKKATKPLSITAVSQNLTTIRRSFSDMTINIWLIEIALIKRLRISREVLM